MVEILSHSLVAVHSAQKLLHRFVELLQFVILVVVEEGIKVEFVFRLKLHFYDGKAVSVAARNHCRSWILITKFRHVGSKAHAHSFVEVEFLLQ